MNNIRVALCRKTAGKKHPEFQKVFNRWQKWPFCKGYIAKQNGHKWSLLALILKIPKTYRGVWKTRKSGIIRPFVATFIHWLTLEV